MVPFASEERRKDTSLSVPRSGDGKIKLPRVNIAA
ncbi:hypothetical protein PC119_g18886 [Phytophthora cactorum]|uniref:Uncharacterized protein n=1 Tax=Phytophthora cactorum TaxID=29920 RepID=A0A8T1BD54_9STRA|nr:hypothetical protein PC114_g19478 [Phytophthora cactorum]KAG2901156.1 hypothetical protein PC117_g21804 [Phytophthora cactorum]KAG2991497.1 hypothetical protein PC119_g18886 [Phytophthora cactorum]KAG3019097.1 hypothetical protein PC120_g10036 [Phytophthora cactorum]KAG4045833.1 hypothetical protein PC123_g18771 [Phytophthora cactorum]